VVLAVTGGEACTPTWGISAAFRSAWPGSLRDAGAGAQLLRPGALLLNEPAAIQNPFFHLAPDWALIPLVILATLATVIASQAVISGAFSVARQSVQMGLLPRMLIVHTSGKERADLRALHQLEPLLRRGGPGLGFKSSSNLAAAYGIAVTGTMLIDTILVAFVMVLLWRWHPLRGGRWWPAPSWRWTSPSLPPTPSRFPRAAGSRSSWAWSPSRCSPPGAAAGKLVRGAGQAGHPDGRLPPAIGSDIHRVSGTAVFMTSSKEGVPPALLHNLKHNQVLHERVVLVTVRPPIRRTSTISTASTCTAWARVSCA
jgi:KUP system potassium uptake protein